MSKIRILKIYSKFRYRRWSNNYTVPEIRLEGKWLEELGFKQGNEVIIEQKKNKLTITVRKEKRA
ncbi:SymE family type I addiction module toxin [Tenacibaculum ovolyticum]|uniref:SymE family type I addiction module toxin n=1 Tax=Tenacibaculum ovolyticum TaxID=104270 RepID=UPI001F1689F2|nr:SymE family type I addiction module toxin [Tenacibaculum ovolyticum]